ncbi:MAG TPA: cytochrome c [Stellaceae bacterium]|nr:cytochrome c [Stellaceae bacterium]
MKLVYVMVALLWVEGALAEGTEAEGDVQKGKALYSQICSHCHGLNMVNPGNASFDLRQFPHDDRTRFFTSVTQGKNQMPAWGDLLESEEIEAIWSYVRSGGKS